VTFGVAPFNWTGRIREEGVCAGDLVAVHASRSFELIAALLAILRSGATYVPLHPGHPQAGSREFFKPSQPRLLLHDGSLSGDWAAGLTRPIDLRDSSPFSTPALDQESTVASDAAAYVMFTSGSSGRPKGVIIPHRGVVHLVKGQTYADFGPQLRTLFMASTAFDASTFELWGPLLNGGSTVVMVPDLPDLRLLEHQLTEHRVNCLWLTAGLFNQIVETRPSLLSHAGHVLTGGEALSEGHVRRALSVAQPPRLTNGYGPTECTTFACTHELQRDEAYVDGRVPIGTPISQTRVSLRHADGQPAAPGEIGELWIGGPKVALGYLQAPELSDSRFVCSPDPAAPDGPPERWYRTGDRCRLRPDGLLEFHGRIDSQVKNFAASAWSRRKSNAASGSTNP